ncbi:hypothetical protein [Streptomyces sp. CBMA123]|uniref:hypothetical protein n=1 Tax=Streptomyces sp. CBMA123 TaxID=1896313 RepID=UPI001661FF31|nr:hypothetical protein [Streptomyces sp. CBMA123]MBD0694610.1 hypothetical protein [Streptomyces sp. CBMA123]
MDNIAAGSASPPHDRDAWRFPLVATVLLPLCQILYWCFALVRAVEVDQCVPRGACGRDWGLQYDVAYGLMAAQVALVATAWVLPPRTRWAPWRFVASAVSVMSGLACSAVIQNFG